LGTVKNPTQEGAKITTTSTNKKKETETIPIMLLGRMLPNTPNIPFYDSTVLQSHKRDEENSNTDEEC